MSASPQPNAVRLSVKGPRLNIENCATMKEEGLALLKGEHSHLVVDMKEVEFVDSSGVGALVGLRKAVGSNGTVTLSNASEFVVRVLELTKLTDVFQIEKRLS